MSVKTDWRGLARQALGMSIQVRQEAGLDLENPLDVYALCDQLRIPFRFVPISMEGMYRRTPAPYILISALRPLGRRVFTCAHELGHHVFAHSSTIDALVKNHKASEVHPPRDPNEFLVDAFAGFLLMPSLGLRQAYAARHVRPEQATPAQHFAVACSFGVGYATLINHLCYGAQLLPRRSISALLSVTPQKIRHALLRSQTISPLVVADEHWRMPTLDAEVGMHLLLPAGAEAASDAIVRVADTLHGRLFRAQRPGIVRLCASDGQWAIFARVARHQYVGLGRYRHFEESPDDTAEDIADGAVSVTTLYAEHTAEERIDD